MRSIYAFLLISLSIGLALAGTMPPNGGRLSMLDYYVRFIVDRDGDSRITIKEFRDFWHGIEPSHETTVEDCRWVFQFYDVNRDGFIDISELEPYVANLDPLWEDTDEPKEIHISFTNDTSVMQVMWVTPVEYLENPIVYWGSDPENLTNSALGSFHTYNVGHFGFHGNIYLAYMTNLSTSSIYYYKVGDTKTGKFSEVKKYKTAPPTFQQQPYLNIAVYGDMGTILPFAGPVNKMIYNNSLKAPYNFSLLVGDIAYAGTGSTKQGEIEPIWDVFGEQIQPWASETAFLPGVGNHEKYYNFTAYLNRYLLPESPTSNKNFWWSFTYADLHIVHMDTEQSDDIGSPQWNYLEQDLKAASENPNINWIFFAGHRPLLSSDKDGWSSHNPNSPRIQHLQGILNKYGVDLVIQGHQHCYERTYPYYKGTVVQTSGSNEKVYYNPLAPVYIVQGTAGALQVEKWIEPQPEWSVIRYQRYGYGRVQIYSNGTLHYQSLDYPDKIGDEFFITKTLKSSSK